MEYFAGLDVSMEETHICIVDREGAIIHEATSRTSPTEIAAALSNAPDCRRVVFEPGFPICRPSDHVAAGEGADQAIDSPSRPAVTPRSGRISGRRPSKLGRSKILPRSGRISSVAS